jgi:hypothetical protein
MMFLSDFHIENLGQAQLFDDSHFIALLLSQANSDKFNIEKQRFSNQFLRFTSNKISNLKLKNAKVLLQLNFQS